ncbi:thiol methyltransferase [Colletotrichum tofieldiae]|uniref:Thiol methyltransferase n=1 Tax=Colletotrichum tofieldiae TaxID=708197 RepID=A0A166XMF2_9PEZI|nr:thiol methyltransferase [Colletotrichum tofieldiae]GKT60673.1 thiol methyltransferase [Colletotrichum tofieldiae]GKT68375.1 thiol methyltransferase [Colletotrichum tofieldiae]
MANDPNKLSTAFADTPLSKHGQKWSAFWEEKYTPWDRGGPSVALLDLLTTRPDLVPPPPSPAEQGQSDSDRPTALVPGCGKGHDAILLAGLGYDVLALDFSPTAIAEAKDNQKAIAARLGAGTEAAEGELDAYTIRHPSGAEPGAVTWLSGDFFSDSWLAEWGREKAFDLIFDYTFLCALPLTARPLWATRMTALLAPHGRLVCLEFPSGKPLSLPGPPWGLTPEVYLALLSRPGEPLEFSSSTQAGDDTDVVIVPPFREDGLKRLELVKPARTHRAGMNEDGTVRDWIHVWGR